MRHSGPGLVGSIDLVESNAPTSVVNNNAPGSNSSLVTNCAPGTKYPFGD